MTQLSPQGQNIVQTNILQILYGQINVETKGSLIEDQELERAHQEKNVLKLQKLPNNTNFDYNRSKEPSKSLWQVDNDFITPCKYRNRMHFPFPGFLFLSKK